MTSQLGLLAIVMYILPNILRNKGDQIMKFGQLTECNMRNIFLKNYLQYMVEKLFPDPVLKKSKLSIPLDQ